MPCYPALALLLGSAMAMDGAWIRRGTALLTAIASCAAAAADRHPGSGAQCPYARRHLQRSGSASLGLHAVARPHGRPDDAVVRLLADAASAGGHRFRDRRGRDISRCSEACLCLHCPDDAAVLSGCATGAGAFDPYLSSRPLAEAILRSPEGKIIADRHYYAFSSIFFYTNRTGLLLNGRVLNCLMVPMPRARPTFSSTTRNLRNFGPRRRDIIWWRATQPFLVWNDWLGGKSLISWRKAAGSSSSPTPRCPTQRCCRPWRTHSLLGRPLPVRCQPWAVFRGPPKGWRLTAVN